MAGPNLAPDLLQQILALQQQNPNGIGTDANGVTRWVNPQGHALADYQLVSIAPRMMEGGANGGQMTPAQQYIIRDTKQGGMVDILDTQGNFLSRDKGANPGNELMTAIALMAGGYAGGNALAGANAAGAGAGSLAATDISIGGAMAGGGGAAGTVGAVGGGTAGAAGLGAAGAGGALGGLISYMPLVTGAAGLYSNYAKGQAAQDAASIQANAAQSGIDEQRRQFDLIQGLLAPYAQAGTKAVGAQGDLVGLNGAQQQQAAIAGLQGSPEFAALMQQGENAILQNASATGGLRGGNTQAALAQFRPQLLNQMINQQYAKLGGLTSIGQNAAAGTGNAGMQTGMTVAKLLGLQGAAGAGGALAEGTTDAGYASALAQMFGMYDGLGKPAVKPSQDTADNQWSIAGGTGLKVNGF